MYLGSSLKKFNLTASEISFFMILKNYDGMTQEELTTIVDVDKAVTTRVVKSLEEKKFISKIQDQNDKRQNRIYATDELKNLFPKVIEELKIFDKDVLKGINQEEINITYNVLMKIKENFDQMLKEKNK